MNRRPSLIPPWVQKTANFLTPHKKYKNRKDELVPVPKIVVHPPPAPEKKSISISQTSAKDSSNSIDSNDHQKRKKKKCEYMLNV